ncbi:globin-like [Ixodes scapularis]|uniref:globin-like n=1 Tax=Ixodes scapularis TaxID=6945 RepID=UPI001A9E112F|nr:globin-like [Ixodes scapularis]
MINLLGQQSRQTTFFSSMGNILTKSLPDSRTGLSKRDTKLIRNSWSMLCKQHPKADQLIFKALFTKHPDFMALFQHFKDKDLGVVLSDPQFALHSSAIIQAFGTIIRSLDDPAGVVALIRKNATDHTTRKGVQPSHFEAMLNVVLEVLQDKLGSRFKPEAITAWEKFIEVGKLLWSEEKKRFVVFW